MDEQNHNRRKMSLETLFLALVFWLLAIAGVIYGSQNWLPPLASEHGLGIDRVMNYLLITVGALFLCGHVVLGYVVLRFGRQRWEATRLPTAKVQRRWSVAVAVLMAFIAEGGVLLLGLPVWEKFYATAAPSDAITIEVTGEQFGWNVRYPGRDGLFGRSDARLISLDNPLGLDSSDPAARDDVVLLSVVYVPVNQPTHIRLRSKDVLHSFFLPNFRVKQDAVPGMTIDFWFVPTKVGTYEIACAELCGFGHYNMRGVLYVVSPDEYRQWLKEERPFFS